VPGSVLWRRLDLLGNREHLRWLHDHSTDDGDREPARVDRVPSVPAWETHALVSP
jgi:hypothetical protein